MMRNGVSSSQASVQRTKICENNFHFSYHHLAAATFLREGEIFEFLARQPADRRDVLHALLGIDRLMEVRQRFIEGRQGCQARGETDTGLSAQYAGDDGQDPS